MFWNSGILAMSWFVTSLERIMILVPMRHSCNYKPQISVPMRHSCNYNPQISVPMRHSCNYNPQQSQQFKFIAILIMFVYTFHCLYHCQFFFLPECGVSTPELIYCWMNWYPTDRLLQDIIINAPWVDQRLCKNLSLLFLVLTGMHRDDILNVANFNHT